MKRTKPYGTLALILLSMALPIALRVMVPISYPFYWSMLIIPAVLVPNWKAASMILLILTGVEYATEFISFKGQVPSEILLFLIGGTAVNWIVFLIVTSVHISNQRITQQLYKQSIMDPLTGAFNRRYYESMIKKLPAQIKKMEQPSYVMFILDIDRFKKINEMYGNLFGDEVLRQVTQVMKQYLRDQDMLVRLGGEQFSILMPAIDESSAKEVANQIHQTVSQTRFIHKDQPVYVTISLGMASYKPSGTVEQWIDKADHALYQAKISGRNRIYIAS